MAELEVCEVMHLTIPQMNELSRYTFGPWGSMKSALWDCRWNDENGATNENALALILRTDEGEFIGWALYCELQEGGHEAMFFVTRRFRRKGWGSFLVEQILELDPKPFVYPHSKQSGELFKKFNTVQYDSGEEYIYAS